MPTERPRQLLSLAYYEAAQEYLRSLPPEHFMEATPQSTQRKVTLESLDLVCARRPDVHVFNELLVQYPVKGQKRPGQVVPDNMVVVHAGELNPEGSYDLPLQPAPPFWMLEYVSKHSKRKDYDDNTVKYERDLKVPYYLLFQPDVLELTLYRHTGRRYVSVKPNEHDRYLIPELELELALLNGWVRYWFRGELLPLPADLLRQLEAATRRAEEATRLAEEATRQAEEATRRAEEADRQLEDERRARQAAEEELARLRAQLGQAKRPRNGPR
jgi:hypothetical protein